MLVYLDESFEPRVREDCMTTAQDLREAILESAVQLVRPKMVTVAETMGELLLPIMWTTLQGMRGNPLLRVTRDGDKGLKITRPNEVPLRHASD